MIKYRWNYHWIYITDISLFHYWRKIVFFHSLQITFWSTFSDICTRITVAHRNLGEIITQLIFQINLCRRKIVSFHNLQITAYFTFSDICTRITLAHRNLDEIITESKFQINQCFSLLWFDWCFPKVLTFQLSPKGTNCHNQTKHLSPVFFVSLCITLNYFESLWITSLKTCN